MSSLHRRMHQTCTYWAPLSYNSYGDLTWAAPVTFTGRFETMTEEFIDTKTGDQVQSRALVWSADTIFAADGYLYLGTSVVTNPETVTGTGKIRRADQVPDVKGQNLLFKAYL